MMMHITQWLLTKAWHDILGHQPIPSVINRCPLHHQPALPPVIGLPLAQGLHGSALRRWLGPITTV
jgi:hypothetical protein